MFNPFSESSEEDARLQFKSKTEALKELDKFYP